MPKLIGWTYHDYLRLPADGFRYELLDGVLVRERTPGARHQAVVENTFSRIAELLDCHYNRGLFRAPMPVVLAHSVILHPDIVYVRPEHRARVNLSGVFGPPDLVAEVLSRSTRERDLTAKRQLYQRHGIPEYWALDPEGREFVVFSLPSSGRYRTSDVFTSGQTAVSRTFGWQLNVDQLFNR